jgi:hypothetical protein
MAGMAFDGRNLWVIDATWPWRLFCHKKTSTLPVLATVDTSALPQTLNTGLTFDGKRLWANDSGGRVICCLNIPPFQVASIIKTIGPPPTASNLYGLTFDGKHLIVSQGWDGVGRPISWVNPQTSRYIDSFYIVANPGTNDLAFDGKYLWEVSNPNNRIYCVNLRSRTEITNFAFAAPMGITFDGKYLWICDDTNIYCVEKS